MTNRITCGGCTNTWTGARTMHCGGCHTTYSGLALFDAHRSQYGDHGACRNPATLTGMHLRDSIWSGPEMTEEQKLARFGQRAS